MRNWAQPRPPGTAREQNRQIGRRICQTSVRPAGAGRARHRDGADQIVITYTAEDAHTVLDRRAMWC
jgi:hypothetical protein